MSIRTLLRNSYYGVVIMIIVVITALLTYVPDKFCNDRSVKECLDPGYFTSCSLCIYETGTFCASSYRACGINDVIRPLVNYTAQHGQVDLSSNKHIAWYIIAGLSGLVVIPFLGILLVLYCQSRERRSRYDISNYSSHV